MPIEVRARTLTPLQGTDSPDERSWRIERRAVVCWWSDRQLLQFIPDRESTVDSPQRFAGLLAHRRLRTPLSWPEVMCSLAKITLPSTIVHSTCSTICGGMRSRSRRRSCHGSRSADVPPLFRFGPQRSPRGSLANLDPTDAKSTRRVLPIIATGWRGR